MSAKLGAGLPGEGLLKAAYLASFFKKTSSPFGVAEYTSSYRRFPQVIFHLGVNGLSFCLAPYRHNCLNVASGPGQPRSDRRVVNLRQATVACLTMTEQVLHTHLKASVRAKDRFLAVPMPNSGWWIISPV
jgi:hypothetical protein